MISATFLLMATTPFCSRRATCARPWKRACRGMRGFVRGCADGAQSSRLPALADGLDIGLQPIEGFPGPLVNGRYHSSRHAIKRCAKTVAGFRRTMLLQ